MPTATVPTLVVPLQKTLGPNTETRYKAITDTKVSVKLLTLFIVFIVILLVGC
jgi:hypothetical protein